jgi:hypothetical protein
MIITFGTTLVYDDTNTDIQIYTTVVHGKKFWVLIKDDNKIYKELTPWSRILLDNFLTEVKKFSVFFFVGSEGSVHYRVPHSPSLDPTLTQMNPVPTLTPYLLKFRLHITFLSTSRSPK